MKKRVLLVILAIVLSVSLMAFAACKAEEEPPVVEEAEVPPEETTKPTEPAEVTEVTMEIISVTDPAETEKTMEVKAKTAPGAECKLVMTLANGDVSGFPKDAVKTADSNGNVEWTWVLFTYTPAGETKIEITATLGGKTATATTSFTAISKY